ncbi:hypothetical protein J8M20_10260 [Pseudoalteromonas luteoviolacea]|uniref:PKD domain-containing protein n=1 Tax=Pseudoalteromonas luteoviolacea TaxID=43657 RepID=UPI001B35F7CF|nr:hypothetical protein [Pseudoalteromonas luteoviolacea]MBQ4811722.1 hypothetical protein [Pseudoalteromonas luteoviolacea]
MSNLNLRKSHKLILFSVVLTSLLSACGGSSNGTTSEPVKRVENKLPSVAISSTVEVESGAEVRLSSSASDPDGSIASYQWSQKSGYGVTIRDKDQASASFTAPVLDTDDTLVFELLVTDNSGGTALDTFSIKVKRTVPENELPIVSISAPAEVEAGAEVRLVSAASDADGSIASYQWSQKSGYGITIRDKDKANASFTAPVLEADETLEIELVVTDDDGATATDIFSVKVKRTAQSPSLYASCNSELARDVLDIYTQNKNFESKIALKKWLCSTPTIEDAEFTKSVSNIFSLENHDLALNEWKTAYCSEDDKNFADSKSSHVLLQNASESASSAWTLCMQNTSALAYYATQKDRTMSDNPQSVVLTINVPADGGQLLNTDIITTNLTAVDSVPTTLESGVTNLNFNIDDVNSESHFELSGHVHNENVSCSYDVPLKPTIDANACEVLRAQSLAQGKLSERDYGYLKDTDQVPLFSAKDGNLIGRYPCALYSN